VSQPNFIRSFFSSYFAFDLVAVVHAGYSLSHEWNSACVCQSNLQCNYCWV